MALSSSERATEITRLIIRDFRPSEYHVSNVNVDVRISDSNKTINVRVRYSVNPGYTDKYYKDSRCASLIYQCTNAYLFDLKEYDIYFQTPEMSHTFYKGDLGAVNNVYFKYTGL